VKKEILIGGIAFLGLAALIAFQMSRDPERSNKIKAHEELQSLVSGLEDFKRQYGDYPGIPPDGMTGLQEKLSSKRLFLALTGWRDTRIEDHVHSKQGKVLIKPESFRLAKMWEPNAPHDNYVLDPWGNPYRFQYIPDSPSRVFILYSEGPDGESIVSAPDDESFTKDGRRVNADNIVVRLHSK